MIKITHFHSGFGMAITDHTGYIEFKKGYAYFSSMGHGYAVAVENIISIEYLDC